MVKKVLFTAVGLLLVVGALAGVKVLQFKTMAAQGATAGPPPEAVAVSEATEVDWQPVLEAIGTITSVQGVTLSAEVPGTVRRIAFESGELVKAGQVLVELDVTTERAQLQAAEANADLARTNLESGEQLVQSGAIAATQWKTLQATSKQSEAELTRLRSIISKKTIRAPFAGRTGMRLINLGQFVGNGDAVVSLQSPDPVYADFALPQQRLAELKVGLDVRVESDVFPDKVYEGKLAAIQPELDPTTRNVRLRATLENPKHELRQGMFVRTQVVLPKTERVLVVPATAILYAPYGDSVFVVGPLPAEKDKPSNGKALAVQQKFVRLGTARGDFVAITQGLTVGDRVVVTGAFKLRNGAPIVINDALKPSVLEAPTPNDT